MSLCEKRSEFKENTTSTQEATPIDSTLPIPNIYQHDVVIA